MPPSQPRDDIRLAYFLRLVPGWIRVAVEFRHHSWHCEQVFALLAEHGAAYCVTSGANLPCVLRATTDFVYVRMHGPDHHQLYAGSYSDADLQWWADRIREWSCAGQDVYVYFNNDGNANAVRNARILQALLTPDAALPVPSEPGPSLRTRDLTDAPDPTRGPGRAGSAPVSSVVQHNTLNWDAARDWCCR